MGSGYYELANYQLSNYQLSNLLIRQHPIQFRRVLLGDFARAAHLPLRLRRLARENVALEGGRADDLARAGLLESLFCPRMGL